jgi:hypothetical protein
MMPQSELPANTTDCGVPLLAGALWTWPAAPSLHRWASLAACMCGCPSLLPNAHPRTATPAHPPATAAAPPPCTHPVHPPLQTSAPTQCTHPCKPPAPQVVDLEEEWGEWLMAAGQTDAAINHFIEAGQSIKALEAAVRARQFGKAAGLIDFLVGRGC